MRTIIAAAAIAIGISPAIAQDNLWYVPANGYVGEALVRWHPVVAACTDAEDVEPLNSAMRAGDQIMTKQLMLMNDCVPLMQGSHGEIIGAEKGPMLLHIRMNYMPGYDDATPESGPELFVRVNDVTSLADQNDHLVSTWQTMVGIK